MENGITDEARKELAEGLAELLADTYGLYLKTHGYHWNVEGPMFRTLHLMFEEQYQELATAVDDIAERIRALGRYAPASYTEFASLSEIPEAKSVPEAMEMVKDLADGHEALVARARKLVSAAEEANDVATADLVTGRIEVHEKTAWMLRSTAD